ncbi:hypothetical protein C8R47DRAFT_1066641 [Mycena vitilis]|nr:hypothetical protein C8R47DRAFT_1066641 [Mycena vitilis]
MAASTNLPSDLALCIGAFVAHKYSGERGQLPFWVGRRGGTHSHTLADRRRAARSAQTHRISYEAVCHRMMARVASTSLMYQNPAIACCGKLIVTQGGEAIEFRPPYSGTQGVEKGSVALGRVCFRWTLREMLADCPFDWGPIQSSIFRTLFPPRCLEPFFMTTGKSCVAPLIFNHSQRRFVVNQSSKCDRPFDSGPSLIQTSTRFFPEYPRQARQVVSQSPASRESSLFQTIPQISFNCVGAVLRLGCARSNKNHPRKYPGAQVGGEGSTARGILQKSPVRLGAESYK